MANRELNKEEYLAGLLRAGLITEEDVNRLREAISVVSKKEIDQALGFPDAYSSAEPTEDVRGLPIPGDPSKEQRDQIADEATPTPAPKDEGAVATEEAARALADAATRVAMAREAGTQPNVADLELVGESPEGSQMVNDVIAGLVGAQQVNDAALRWMYNTGGLAGQYGSHDIKEIAMLLINTNSRVTVDDMMYKGPGYENMSTEQRFQRGAEEYFSNQNETTQFAVEQYGRANDLFMDADDRAAWEVSQELGMTVGQARAFADSAKTHDIDPMLAAKVYKIQRDKGLVSEPWTAPQGAFNIDDLTKVLTGRGMVPSSSRGYGGVSGRRAQPDYAPERRVGVDEYGQSVAPGEDYIATPAVMMSRLNNLMDKYGSELVATVALVSPDLADRMYRDPYSLTAEEWTQVDDMIGGTGQWHGGSAASAAQASFIEQRMSGMKDVVRVDVDGAKEAARTLAASWNMPELSDSFLSHIASGTVAANLQAIRAAQGNPFRPSMGGPEAVNVPGPYAAAAKALRGTPEYQILFANLRSGESEEEYATRFDSAVNKFMGDTDPGLARAGMKSGSTATVGQAAMSSGAAYENSNFMDRLTQMGNAFKEAT